MKTRATAETGWRDRMEAKGIHVGDRVVVTEQGIRPWTGRVGAIKPAARTFCRYEVRRDDDGMTWSVTPDCVEMEARA